MATSLPEELTGLLRPCAYPHPAASVTVIETHISWVFLTGTFAYKVKRPIRFPFVDFSSARQREHFCREELRLNRRFAPQLYLEVCPIYMTEGRASLIGAGEPVEHAVMMRQFSREQELDSLLAAGRIETGELTAFGTALADIHARLPATDSPGPWGDPQSVCQGIWRNFAECAQASATFAARPSIEDLRSALARNVAPAIAWMAERLEARRVRECHGDLHAQNIVRLESGLTAFDCLEFEPAFRWIDVADEVAFLTMDLESRGYVPHSQAFLDAYLSRSGDYQLCRVLRVYLAHRALVRAKVQTLNEPALRDPQEYARARERHAQYVAYAAATLQEEFRGALLLMTGLSGSGKTWLARRLAPRLGAVHLRSDTERKRLAGLADSARTQSGLGAGLYSSEMSNKVYEHLAQSAEHVLAGHRSVIVDATCSRRAQRLLFADVAKRMGVPAYLIHCHASPNVLAARVRERHEKEQDASEADVAVVDWQRQRWEPLAADESWNVVEVDTTATDLEEVLRRVGFSRRT